MVYSANLSERSYIKYEDRRYVCKDNIMTILMTKRF